jgi:hypothetical protein
MIGVLTVFQGDMSRLEEGKRALQEQIIPALKAHKGFQHGFWLLNAKTAELHVATIWEDQAALQEGMATLQQVREQAAAGLGLTVKTSEAPLDVLAAF